MNIDNFIKDNIIFEEKNFEYLNDLDTEILRISKDLYKYIDNFIPVFYNIKESKTYEVSDILFKSVNHIDLMEDNINNMMGVLYSIFMNEKIRVEKYDLHNMIGDNGNSDIQLNNSLYLEGKRIPLGYSKYNKGKGILVNSKYTLIDLYTEIDRQILRFVKHPNRPDILSFFVPLHFKEFDDLSKQELLDILNERFSKYISIYNSQYLFKDICFFINWENKKENDNVKGELLFISLNRNYFISLEYKIYNIVSENPDKNTKEIEPCLRLEIPFYNKKGCFEFLSFNSEKKSILKVFEKESKNCAVYGYGDILFLFGILQSNSINLAYNLYKDNDLFNGIQALYLKKFDKKLEGKFKISALVSIDSKFKDKNIGLMKQVITVI